MKWAIGTAVLLGIVAVTLVLFVRRSIPPLTADALQSAEGRWQGAQVKNYAVEIEVRGAQPAVYAVEVRDGEPISATRNGNPLTQRRTWETWTVPGMFDTLASDVESIESRSNLVVRCKFADKTGLPEQYERIEMGTGQQVSWTVKRFEPQQ